MKKLTNKVRILEAKATRRLHKKSAADHARQAAKFRMDSLKLGCELAQVGSNPYKTVHPVYDELIQPLLMQAAEIGKKYGFNMLFQVHTPMPGMERFTSCIGSLDKEKLTPTMAECVKIIEATPTFVSKNGKLTTEPRVQPLVPDATPPEASEDLTQSNL